MMDLSETAYTRAKKEKDEIIEGCIKELQQNKERVPIDPTILLQVAQRSNTCIPTFLESGAYRYIVKDENILTDKLENTPWVASWLIPQLRTDVVMRPSFVNSNVSFLEWIVACAFPICPLIKPMIQKFISDTTLDIARDSWEFANLSYNRMDRTMVRETCLRNGDDRWIEGIGMNPITWYLIHKRIANLEKSGCKPFPKDAEVHPLTEELYSNFGTMDKTYKETLLAADTYWKEQEEKLRETDCAHWLFREEVATTMIEAILSYDGKQAPANQYLFEEAYLKAELDDCDIMDFLRNLETTFAWVQYIRALVDDASEKDLKEAATQITDIYSEKNKTFEYEMWFLFDAIHRIFIKV